MFVWSGETLWNHMLSMFHAQRVFDLPWFRITCFTTLCCFFENFIQFKKRHVANAVSDEESQDLGLWVTPITLNKVDLLHSSNCSVLRTGGLSINTETSKVLRWAATQKPLLMSDLHHPKWQISLRSWEFDSFTILYSAKTTGILGTHVVIKNGAFLHELKTLGATMISITCAMASAWHKNEQQVEHVHSCVNRELSTTRSTISQSLENLLCQKCEQNKYHHRSWHEQYMQRFSSHELTFSNYKCLCMGCASAGPSGRLKRFESHRNWESCPAQPAETWRQNMTYHIKYINMFWCTLNKVEAFQTRHFKIEIQSKQIFEYKTIQGTSEIWYLTLKCTGFERIHGCKKSSSFVQQNELSTYCNCV